MFRVWGLGFRGTGYRRYLTDGLFGHPSGRGIGGFSLADAVMLWKRLVLLPAVSRADYEWFRQQALMHPASPWALLTSAIDSRKLVPGQRFSIQLPPKLVGLGFRV